MVKKILLLFITLSFCFLAKAQITVNVTVAGELESTLESLYPPLTGITDLTVTGTIDARDFKTIRDELPNLVKLNLTGTTIAAFNGTGGPNLNLTTGANVTFNYPAGSVPQYSFYVPRIANLFGNEIAPERKLNLQSLQLPAGITAIGERALGKLLKLTATTLDLSSHTQLTTIGNYVFYQDSTLVSIILPPSVSSIGSGVFQDCAALTSFTVPAATTTLGSALLSGCANISAINFESPSSITSIPYGFFAGMAQLKKVTIPASVTTMPISAFVYNSNTYFTGDSIFVDAANTAFSSHDGVLYNKAQTTLLYCPYGIPNPNILSTTEAIGEQAFRYGRLTNITIPTSIKTIGTYVFSESKLESVTFASPSSLESIGNNGFWRDTFLVEVNLPPSLKTLGNEVFNGDKSLKSIALPAGITSIGNSTFSYSGLLTADFSALTALTSWGTTTFQYCDSLTSVQLPPNYATIPGNTFTSCKALKSFNVPSVITAIGASAFSSSGVEIVTLPEGLISIGATAFGLTPLKSVFIPKTVTTLTMGTGSPFNRIPGRITVDPENPNFSSIGGVLYSKDTTTLIEAPVFLSGAFVIPNTVTTIETYAFQSDTLLTSIELSKSLTAATSIKGYAFFGCNNLKQIITKNPVPAPLTGSPFGSAPTGTCILYVPKGKVADYRAANQWKNFTTIKEASLFYDLGNGYPYKISPSGKYLTGFNGFLWENKEDGDNTVTPIPQGSGAKDVNDSGVIVADFTDNIFIVQGTGIESGGVYKEGVWYSLGLGRYGATTTSREAGSSVNAITADGWVFGMTHETNSVARVAPMVWKPDGVTGQYTDTLVYSFPEDNLPIADRLQGTRFIDASEHGEIACGWAVYAATHGARRPIVWTSPTDYKILNPNFPGEAHDVSPNGKYIAVTTDRKAALYDVENDTLIIFGPTETSAVSVSNDGLVVGFHTTAAEGRVGFLWSDKLGYTPLKDFIDRYTPEIILSEDFQFSNSENEYIMDVPMTISGDGLVFAGWRGAGIMRKIWVVALAAPLDLVSRPSGLTASVDPVVRNEVALSWSAPTDIAGHLLDFYYIYRNGTYVGQVESDATTYIDTNVPSGQTVYSVSAVYDFNGIANTYRESNKSESIKIGIVDNYNLPFYDGFESNGYASNYWNVTTNDASNGWTVYSEGYAETPGHSSVFVAGGDQTSYSHTLTSKPLDATGETKVTASFLYKIVANTPVGVKDTIYFEVSNDIYGTTWNVVKYYVLSAAQPWTTQTLDISDLVKGNIFKARFRAVSGSNRTTLIFFIDEFAIAVAPVTAPGTVIADKKSGKVQVNWQDPSGSYGLTYAQSSKKDIIGNEGVPFIAVNKFSKEELSAYNGLKLTSISAYINAKGSNATVDTKLKLAVFVDNVRVTTQDIESFQENAWNTFLLNEPIVLTNVNAELAFGIDVVEHDATTRPLGTDKNGTVQGKGDAFTEDGGDTWDSLTAWNYLQSWCIIGNVRGAASGTERTPNILGYEIYRGDVKINTGLTFNQAFVDSTATVDTPCYTVKAFYATGGLSGASAIGCVLSDDATLASLTVSSGTLTPAFNANTTSYTASVPFEVENITITGTANYSGATVEGNGSKALTVGENPFNLVVTAANGEKKTYTVVVTRAKSADATLASLTVSSGTLTPAFNANTTSYTVSVLFEVETITITGTANYSGATVEGNGSKALTVGENPFNLVVTAANGEKKTYTVNVTRADYVGLTTVSATEFTVYPNPTAGKVYIKNETGKTPEIIVCNLMGKTLLRTHENSIDLSAFADGIYLLYVDGKAVKVIKK